MSWKIVISLILFSYISVSYSQGIRFVSPIGGQYLHDYFIPRYFDCGKYNEKSKDPFCGTKTFKGHEGTDFVLRSFRQMDSLVPVYAVADGVVYSTIDSMPDRNKGKYITVRDDNGWDIIWSKFKYGNQIVINHKDSLYTLYANLKEFSIEVKPGDKVKSGQLIAYVGNSGYSSDPQLHFEVRHKYTNDYNDFTDPFAAPCSNNKSLWINQPPYDTTIRVIESGFVPYAPKSPDSLAERIGVKKDFDKNDSIINHWILISGLHKDDILRTEWYQSDWTLWHRYQMVIKNVNWYGYYWSWIRNPIKKLTTGDSWICAVFVNNKLIMQEKFNVRNQNTSK